MSALGFASVMHVISAQCLAQVVMNVVATCG